MLAKKVHRCCMHSLKVRKYSKKTSTVTKSFYLLNLLAHCTEKKVNNIES